MKKTMCRYLRYLREPLVIGLIVTVLGVVVVAAGDGTWAAPGQSPLSQTVPPRPPPPRDPEPEPPPPNPELPPPAPGSSQGNSDSSEGNPFLPIEDNPLQVPGPDEPTVTDTPESGESSVAGSHTANATPAPSGEARGDAGSHSVAVLQGNDSLPFRTPVSPSNRQGLQDSEATGREEKKEGRHGAQSWLSSFYLLPLGSLLFVVVGVYLVISSRSERP